MVTVGFERLETSALGLTFQVKPKYVNLGLKLECTASIGSVYWQSFQETPKVSPREQPAISGNWWTSSHASSKQNPKCKKFHNTFYLPKYLLTYLLHTYNSRYYINWVYYFRRVLSHFCFFLKKILETWTL